jgi:hypothetical protein
MILTMMLVMMKWTWIGRRSTLCYEDVTLLMLPILDGMELGNERKEATNILLLVRHILYPY